MRRRHDHPSDAELLLFAEEELSASRMAAVADHFTDCENCRQRRRDLESVMSSFRQRYRSSTADLPGVDDARARLTRELGMHQRRPSNPNSVMGLSVRQWGTLGAASVALVVLAALALPRSTRDSTRTSDPRGAEQAIHIAAAGANLPRPDLTPGAARTVSVEEVCAPRGSESPPTIDVSVAQHVFQEYGADYQRAEEYELDFLITPELGGTADTRNLWPQPYRSTRWNAYVKDELEQLFKQRVCEGAMDIATAQREIATDWISAYRRYFDTEQPRVGARRDG